MRPVPPGPTGTSTRPVACPVGSYTVGVCGGCRGYSLPAFRASAKGLSSKKKTGYGRGRTRVAILYYELPARVLDVCGNPGADCSALGYRNRRVWCEGWYV